MNYRQNGNKAQYLEDYLQHHGVKGMKWGVRRSPAQLARAAKGRAKDEWKSAKRERSWKKVAKASLGKSDAEIQRLAMRIKNENDLKSLSRREYLQRDKMDDKEITDRVRRLRLQSALMAEAGKARSGQIEAGASIAKAAIGIGIGATITPAAGRSYMVRTAVKKELKSAGKRAAMTAAERKFPEVFEGVDLVKGGYSKGIDYRSDVLVDPDKPKKKKG